MMNKILSLLTFAFSIVILFSCEPNRDTNGDYLIGVNQSGGTSGGTGGGTGGGTTGRLLKKIISHEKNDETGLFEDTEMTFNYTGNKLISTKDDRGEVTTFSYNANGKMDKIVATGQLTTFEYNNNNVSKTVTEIAGVAKLTGNFSYVAGKLTKTISIQEYTLPIPIKNYVETTYEYQGANISKGIIKAGIYLPNGNLEMNPESTVIDFTYDQKISPYSLLPKEFAFYVSGIAPQGVAFFSGNNLTKYVITVGGMPEIVNYSYEYDSAGYASKMVEGEDYTKYEY